MALNATIYSFEITLNDADRGVYQTLEFRAAQHPSETAAYLVTRGLAYGLEFTEGLTFSKGGLSDPDSPALAVHDLTGALQSWIEVGAPEAARLHKAAKAARRVVVYAHKNVATLRERLKAESVFRADDIEVYAFTPEFLAGLVARLDRRMRFDLTVSERQLYLTIGGETLSGTVMVSGRGTAQ